MVGPQKKPITFLDLGSGMFAERGWKLAEKRGKRPEDRRGQFVSVDKERGVLVDEYGKIIGQSHRAFHQGDALEFLKRREPNSVKVANDELLLDYKLLVRHKAELERVGAQAMERAQELKAASHNEAGQYAKEVFRVLKPNGRFLVVVHGYFKNILADELRQQGFQILSEKMLTKEEILAKGSEFEKHALGNFGKTVGKYSKPDGLRLLAPAYGFKADVPAEVLASLFRISARKPQR
ncbi:MAG: hypothetical protein V1676_00685 [Candidatus Diapherotrites archaeon]